MLQPYFSWGLDSCDAFPWPASHTVLRMPCSHPGPPFSSPPTRHEVMRRHKADWMAIAAATLFLLAHFRHPALGPSALHVPSRPFAFPHPLSCSAPSRFRLLHRCSLAVHHLRLLHPGAPLSSLHTAARSCCTSSCKSSITLCCRSTSRVRSASSPCPTCCCCCCCSCCFAGCPAPSWACPPAAGWAAA